ncbi:amino acid/amide ABC transporter substrate-binding protein, HAAT family [Bernardetia litoralis DSM 6794]|uniref:Amino acid/amide ABC transporter substrate-binding protein, HAAT family n=1 Tax=Bernardetia litoralis (strain ATCC 23117 / DSM 6794 / NBRC 15988 / NCIMB 1366 / Fx l1 / Sio-4) TaxID=880071 RepID=I4ANK8_BERLS|nr:ABC transporter substrate-binding protein [Bernardetia litoralis]AFM05543.1 amino acid/amide ABC transporter substrate-binding protein, HAAT family [Bernardetia litoralis DSM 6794]
MRFTLFLSIIASLLFSFSPIFSFAQVDYQSYYQKGKTELSNKNYSAARQSLIMAMQENSSNGFLFPASYLYVMASYKGGDLATAYTKVSELLIKAKNATLPSDQFQEMLYLGGVIAFEKDQSLQAMTWLEQIKGSKLHIPVQNLKATFLPKKSVAELKLLYQKFSKDRVLSETLADKIAQQDETSEEDKKIIKDIEFAYGYTSPYQKKQNSVSDKIVKKKEYNVAIMLPFRLQNESSAREVQSFLDLYEGMKVAQEDLKNEGITINLLPFDTENDANNVRRLIGLSAMKNVDMFFGPLYPTTLPIVSDFAQENGISMVNPLSYTPDLIEGKKNTYLFESSYHTQAKAVANYSFDSLNADKAYIIYGNSRKDSILAYSYKKTVEEKGGKIMVFEKVNAGSSTFNKIRSLLSPIAKKPARLKEGEKFKKPEGDTTAHIFVASSELAVAGSVISVLKTSMVDIPLFIDKDWLNFEQIDMNDFMDRSVFFIYTDYISPLKNKEFVKKYINKTNLLPSEYAYVGYESLYFFGKTMYKYGVNFENQLQKERFRDGKVMIGQNYYGSNDNQLVPLLRFVNNRLEIVNHFYKD